MKYITLLALAALLVSCIKPHNDCKTYIARAPQQRAEMIACDGIVPDTAKWIIKP